LEKAKKQVEARAKQAEVYKKQARYILNDKSLAPKVRREKIAQLSKKVSKLKEAEQRGLERLVLIRDRNLAKVKIHEQEIRELEERGVEERGALVEESDPPRELGGAELSDAGLISPSDE
jgi:hypothetical protein